MLKKLEKFVKTYCSRSNLKFYFLLAFCLFIFEFIYEFYSEKKELIKTMDSISESSIKNSLGDIKLLGPNEKRTFFQFGKDYDQGRLRLYSSYAVIFNKVNFVWPIINTLVKAFFLGLIILFYVKKSVRILFKKIPQQKKTSDRELDFQFKEEVSDFIYEYVEKNEKKIEAISEKNRELNSLMGKKTSFFQNISHELRTPLTLIMGSMESLMKDYGDDEDLVVANKNVTRLYRLTNQLLDYHKVSSEKKMLDLVPINLTKFLLICGTMFKKGLPEGLNFKFTIFGKDFVEGDEKQLDFYTETNIDALEKIIFNYLSNALKYSPKNGTITLDIIREGDSLWVSVLDEGKGISTKDQKKIFNKFGKADESQINKHEGTGLGLAFVKELSEALETEVGVEARKYGGARFWLSLKSYFPKDICDILFVLEDEVFNSEEFKKFEKRIQESHWKYIKLSSGGEVYQFLKENIPRVAIVGDFESYGAEDLNSLYYNILESISESSLFIYNQETSFNEIFFEDLKDEITKNKITKIPISFDYEVADVLIVEDSEVTIGYYKEIIKNLKGQKDVYYALNAEEARKYLKKFKFKLVICDYNLPGENGIELLNYIGYSSPETVKFLITELRGGQIFKGHLKKSGIKVKLKPWNQDDLIMTIKTLTEDSKLISGDSYKPKKWHLSISNEKKKKINRVVEVDEFIGNGELILVIDDNDDMRKMIVKKLKSLKYKVESAVNG